MDKRAYFLKLFNLAQRTYGAVDKRLAGDDWPKGWQTLVATIMSAQTRDEITIPVAERLFARYPSLKKLARARSSDVLRIIRPVNFSTTKARHIVQTARILLKDFKGCVPDTIEALVMLPGVGRKTANLVLSEVHKKESITVDTHVHRLCNVLELVRTRTPEQTEQALMRFAPRPYWSRINRLFVLWGKQVPGRDKDRLLEALR